MEIELKHPTKATRKLVEGVDYTISGQVITLYEPLSDDERVVPEDAMVYTRKIGDTFIYHPLSLDSRQLDLFEFVKEAHGEQVRKYTGLPYTTHLLEVAAIGEYFYPDTDFMIEVGLCHDLLEDTNVSSGTLAHSLINIGYTGLEADEITTAVETLTDWDLGDTRRLRKSYYNLQLSQGTGLAQMIKLADICSNFADTTVMEPAYLLMYADEKINTLQAIPRPACKLHQLASSLVYHAQAEAIIRNKSL